MKVFVAWTVDHLDGLTASALMADNVEELRRISSEIRRAAENVKAWAMAVGGAPILDLGAVGVVEVPADRMTELPAIAKKFEDICEGTLSVGVGMTISEANSAMKYAALHGGDQISLYTPEMEDALAERNDKGDEVFANLGKSQKVGSEEPVGFADGPPEEQPGMASPPPDPQHGGAHPAEGHGVQTGEPQVASPAQGAMEVSGAGGAAQGDPNGGQPQEGGEEDPMQFIVQSLMAIKQQAPVLEQLKESNPDAFEAVKNVVQAMIQLAQGVTQEGGEEEGGEGESVQKSEESEKSLDEVSGEESSVVEEMVQGGDVTIKAEYPAAKPHIEHPVGAMKEGKVKVEHRDPATGAAQGTGWNSVRSGQVLSEDGHAVSSRNPSGR